VPFSSGDEAMIKNLYRFKNSFRRKLAKFLKINCNGERVGMLLKRFGKHAALTAD